MHFQHEEHGHSAHDDLIHGDTPDQHGRKGEETKFKGKEDHAIDARNAEGDDSDASDDEGAEEKPSPEQSEDQEEGDEGVSKEDVKDSLERAVVSHSWSLPPAANFGCPENCCPESRHERGGQGE